MKPHPSQSVFQNHTLFSRRVGAVFGALFVLWLMPASATEVAPTPTYEIAVLPFELHDLTLNPDTSGETRRTATLQPLLQAELLTHNIAVVENPASAAVEANKGAGYIFDRPTVSARIGREAGVDWIVSGRLHKASFLFVYLKSQLINVKTGAISADFVVEIKGPQKKLTHKGVETLAVQIVEALLELEPQND